MRRWPLVMASTPCAPQAATSSAATLHDIATGRWEVPGQAMVEEAGGGQVASWLGKDYEFLPRGNRKASLTAAWPEAYEDLMPCCL